MIILNEDNSQMGEQDKPQKSKKPKVKKEKKEKVKKIRPVKSKTKDTESKSNGKNRLKFGFKNWKIKNKVLAGFIVIIVALIYVTISSYNFIGLIAYTYIPVIEAQNQLGTTVQSMNSTQRDFMLLDRTNEDFYKAAADLPEGQLSQTERTIAFDGFYQRAIEDIGKLSDAKLIKNDKALFDQTTLLKQELETYKANFDGMHASIQKRGFDRFGVVGNIDTMKKKLKIKLAAMPQDSNLDKAMANLDNAHVNYLYTQEKRFLDQIKDQLNYPNTQVQFGDFTQAYKDEYKSLSEGYIDAFAELIALDDTIGRNPTEGYFAAITDSSARVSEVATLLNTSIKTKMTDAIKGLIGKLILLVLVITGLAIAFAIILANVISKPVNNVNHMLKDISEGEGDLTKSLDIKTKEEMGTMANLFNQFVSKIRAVVVQVKKSAASLSGYTDEIHDAIDQANESIEHINVEVQSMIDGLQNNASVVEQTTASIQELSSSAQMISKEADLVVKDSESVLSASKQGVEKLETVVNSIEQVKESSESMATVINTLKLSSDEIVEIVNIINAIAEQTSLLALNASIEAARAGEHGRGFSVVAEEVRKLADQSKGSAFKINDIIKQISTDIQGASVTMNKEKALVDRSVSEAYDTSESFKLILALIEGINHKISNISEGASQQSQISEEMAKAIDELSNIMQDNVSSSERIGSSIENQVATFEEIAASISELKNMATVLEAETNRFKVE